MPPKNKRRDYHSNNFIRLSNDDRINELFDMITKVCTTSILNQLEYYRQNLNQSQYKALIFSLTQTLNSETWKTYITNQNSFTATSTRYKPRFYNQPQVFKSNIQNITSCCCIIYYYIISVIKKYEISSSEVIWNEILRNSITKTKQFYEYLYRNKIIIPRKTCEFLSKELNLFYSTQPTSFQFKLFQLGFIFPKLITEITPIKYLEKIFSQLKQRDIYENDIFNPENLIAYMNTPEKLSLFLSHFSDYDINQINISTYLNVLEQVINMKPYFYPLDPTQTQRNRRRYRWFSNSIGDTIEPFERPQIGSYPNEIKKYRTARIINLIQQLINRGAKLTKSIHFAMISSNTREHPFLLTSIGIYVLISLNMNDIHSNELLSNNNENISGQRSLRMPYRGVYHNVNYERQNEENQFISYDQNSFITFIIKYIEIFDQEFQGFIINHLRLSYSIIHTEEFINERRRNETEEEQQINDILFHQSLKLKEWCRLKIKDICLQRDINKLNLSRRLTNYCSYGFSEPNFSLQCIKEVTRYKGDIEPTAISNEMYSQYFSRARGRGYW